MGPIGCPEISVTKSTLRKSPEEGRSHLNPPRQKPEIAHGTPRRCNVWCAWTPVVTSMYSLKLRLLYIN
jgi:hypothetical protein